MNMQVEAEDLREATGTQVNEIQVADMGMQEEMVQENTEVQRSDSNMTEVGMEST